MDQLKAWWSDASMRDQLSLVALVMCAVVFLLFQFVYEPVSSMRAEQENRIVSQRAAYERVKGLADTWKQHTAKGSSENESSGVEKLVQSSFAKHHIRVSGFDASGRSGIRVRFESISYEKLVGWMHDIELGQGLRLKDVSVAGTSVAGVVSASILIGKD